MPIVEPSNESVLEFEGLHLYHADRSNCSARVRLLLEEKQLPWFSHHINLKDKENISEEYYGINPKGLVPALVHDGAVIVESNDILDYLERQFPEPGFRAVPNEDQPAIDRWLKTSGDIHLPGIKTFQYYKRNARLIKKSDDEFQRYRELQTDPELLQFHAKHGAPGSSFTEKDVAEATRLLDAQFAVMEQSLSGSDWIVGDTYTLVDISWGPTITTLTIGGFDFSAYPNVRAWYDRVSSRPQYETAVHKWIRESPWGHE